MVSSLFLLGLGLPRGGLGETEEEWEVNATPSIPWIPLGSLQWSWALWPLSLRGSCRQEQNGPPAPHKPAANGHVPLHLVPSWCPELDPQQSRRGHSYLSFPKDSSVSLLSQPWPTYSPLTRIRSVPYRFPPFGYLLPSWSVPNIQGMS